ncbi:MAG TPA: SPOR domain-containing protein, partial [Methylococcaceae bacterium]|nr:SPOR domain-containing protein [Methylococcaceae bacterium]
KESIAEPAEEPYDAPAARRDDARDPLDMPARTAPDAAEKESLARQPASEGEDEEDFPAPPAKPAPTPAKPAATAVAPPAKPAPKPAKPVAEPATAVKTPAQEAVVPKQTAAPKPVKKKTVTTTALPKAPTPALSATGRTAEGVQTGAAKQEVRAVPPVPPSPAKPAPAPTAAPAGESASPAKEPANLSWWMIQAGSFDDEANAKNLKTRLLQAKIPAFSEKITNPNGDVKYRVRVGPEKERAKAEEILKRMEGEAGVKGMIVSYP